MAKPTLPDLRSPIKEFARTEKMLHAVRDLNHLIIKEKDMNRLLSKACDLLVESCGYYNAMIILLDDGKPLEPFFRAGFGGNFTSMASFLRKGSLPDCAENSLRASGLITINDLPSHCTNCPLAPKYNGRAGMAMRLEQAGRIFGWVNVSISRELSKNDDEKALFTDLVDNIAFAIWSLENAIQRERLEKKYAAVIETSPNTVHEFDTEGRITIYENAPQAYQSLDENGCILDVNPAWLKAMGYEREQVIGKPYSAFLHPDWRPHFEKHFPEFKRRGYIHDLNFKLRHKKGHYIDVSFEGCASYHPDGRFRQTNCVFKDITRQKRTEEALRKSRRQVATLMGNLPGMAYRCRYMASRPMMFVSEGCEELTGYSSQDLMPGGTVTYGDLIHPEDRASVWNSVQAAAADEAQFTIEYRIMDKSGRERWVWERGRVVDVDTDGTDIIEGFISDITVRKKIETDLEWNVRRNKILSNIAARLLRSDDPQRLVDNLCRQVMDFLGCDIYFNFLVDPLTEQLRLNASAGIPADEAHALGWRDYGAAVCARVTRNINRIVHEDILHTEGSDNDFLKSQGIQVCCCFPLRIQDRLIGTLSFGNRSRPGFSDAEIDLMAAVADLVAVAMHRIETENSLRESERKFRDIFDGTSDAVYIHDMSGNIFEANAASSSQLGYSREKILCMTPADIEFEADNKRVQERIQAIRRKEDLVFESVHRREDGRTFPVEVHSRIIDFEGQQCILSVVRDISERLTLESKIREEEAKFLAFMKYLPGFAYIKDADRKHLFVNESMETLFGKPKEQWIGRRFEEVVQIPEAQEIKNNDEALLFNREPIIVEERIQIDKDEQFY